MVSALIHHTNVDRDNLINFTYIVKAMYEYWPILERDDANGNMERK